jgi:hypothetical protein
VLLLPPEPAKPVLALVFPPELPVRPPEPPAGLLLAGAVPALPPTAEAVEPPPPLLDPPAWVLELEV